MAKAGDPVPEVLEVRSATAGDGIRNVAAFSLKTTEGEANFAISFERLGHLVSHALNLAQEHARALQRPAILSGANTTIEAIPETITVSFQEVSEKPDHPRLVVVFGDLTLSFLVDKELIKDALEKFSGPASSLAMSAEHIGSSLSFGQDGELRLPTHCTQTMPTEVSTLPVKWAPYVGFITVLWGRFETQLDELLATLIATNKTELPDQWRLQNFRKRKNQFLKEVAITFFDQQNILTYCRMLANDAAKFHVPRNLLVHGKLYGSMDSQDYVLTAVIRRKGKLIRARFKEPELLSLYYDVANLCGRIAFLFDPDDSPRKPQPFSSQEKQILRDLLHHSHRTRTTSSTP